MICLKCKTRPICKIFDTISTTYGLEVEIKKCIYENIQLFESFHGTSLKQETVIATAHARDLNNIASKIKKVTEKKKSLIDEKSISTCFECKKDFPTNETFVCSGCGEHYCEVHCTEDMSSKKKYCENCWDKIAPPSCIE